MAGRFVFPQAYDPHMARDDAIQLARSTSQGRNEIQKVNTSQSVQTVDRSTSNSNSPQSAMSKPTSASQITKRAPTIPQRRHFVFADPVAFRYLEEDASTVVVERRGSLKGYEMFLVEQWACSRVHPTFIITTYTGDMSHSVLVGVLGVPADEDAWSPRLRVYFKAISQFHARPKETPLGMLFVTNLSSFPSALTVITVPDGDVRRHREDFIVNENLKRLGCSGRSGMSLSTPAAATQAKFFQLYKTSDRIPLYGAVIELVKLCQVALLIFGKLEQEYADGLLCDVTEKAINDWWTEIGSEYFNDEPTDGILGPTTVSALLGMLMGARNRLNYYGAPVSKDAFDVFSLKRGISYFQKSQKMDRTRRLDRRTLNRLHSATAKAAAGEGWTVPKAVKSTVAELGGKGGEMVMGMVGRDKAGIGDIETLDFEKYVTLVHGERAKWLWYGKPRRTGPGESRPDADPVNMTFKKDDHGGYIWSNNKSDSVPPEDEAQTRRKESPDDVFSAKPPGSAINVTENGNDRDPQLRKTVFKSVTGKMGDARSGFGRIKDAVGLRGHASKPSKDDDYDSRQARTLGPMGQYFSPSSSNLSSVASPTVGVGKAFTWKNTPEEYKNGAPKPKETANITESARKSESLHNESTGNLSGSAIEREIAPKDTEAAARWAEQVRDIRQTLVAHDPSVAGSAYGDDLEGPLLEAERAPHNFQVLLHRRHSIHTSPSKRPRNEAWWARCMSFSDAEDAVLNWEPVGVFRDDGDKSDTWVALQKQKLIAEDFKTLYEKVSDLQDRIGPWVERKVDSVDVLDDQAGQDQEGFQTLFYQLSESYQAIKENSQEILADERSHVMETIKDIEVLGAKLEYEINALISKVQDVEDGVSQFERQVDDLEIRADELLVYLNHESWAHWLVRTVTGIGSRPTQKKPLHR